MRDQSVLYSGIHVNTRSKILLILLRTADGGLRPALEGGVRKGGGGGNRGAWPTKKGAGLNEKWAWPIKKWARPGGLWAGPKGRGGA